MDLKKALLFIATKQFNLTEEEAAEMLLDGDEVKDDGPDKFLARAADTVTRLKKERDDYFNRGHQKATKEIMPGVEAKFRELTGYTDDAADFDDLVKKYLEHSAKSQKASKVSEDDVKKHPLFIELETKRVPKEEYEKLQGEFTNFKKNVQKEAVLGRIREKAWEVVAKKNPIMSDNPVVANNRKSDFLNKFGTYDYDEQDGQVVVLSDGKRLEDAHGNLKPFDAFVMDLASLNFDFRAQEDRGQAGNQGGTQGTVTITETPKTRAELNAVLDKYSANTPDDIRKRAAAVDFWEKNKTD